MKITIKVKTNSKIEGVEKSADNTYVVRTRVAPVEGQANLRVIELLAQYFKLPKSSIKIVRGLKSKNKIFEIKV
jgi:uncharacterized protein YggU (UPF0235/DUF167 family)